MNTKHAADALGIKVRTVANHIRTGKIAATRGSGDDARATDWRISEDEVARYKALQATFKTPEWASARARKGVASRDNRSLRQYQAAVDAANAGSGPAPDAALPELPLSSAGEPVIDRAQQAQLAQSAQLAADEQVAALRAAALADDANRAPDVSYADAVALLHRDPCHVPRADPATCARGLFKPTPVR